MPAKKDDNRLGRERRERLLDGVGVRGLGVVHEVDARDLAAGLDAVLDRAEARKAARHDVFAHADEQRERGGRQGVLPVVATADLQVVGAPEVVLHPVQADDEPIASDEGGIAAAELAVDGQLADAQAALGAAHRDGAAPVVVHRDDGEVAGAHVGEDLLLGGGVGLHGAVPLDVVGRDVEQRRRARVEPRGLGELETRELGHEPAALGTMADLADAEHADVAHGLGRAAVLVEQVRGERGRGGLAVRAGDGYPVARALAEGELGLADNLGARGRGGAEKGALLGDAGRSDGEVEGSLHVLGAEHAAHAHPLEGPRSVALLGARAAVERDGVDAPGGETGEVAANALSRLADAKDEYVSELLCVRAGHALALSLAVRCGPLRRASCKEVPGQRRLGTSCQRPSLRRASLPELEV